MSTEARLTLATLRSYGIRLALFAALTTGLSGVVHLLTGPVIANQAALQQQALLDNVIPAMLYNNPLRSECYAVTDVALGSTRPHRLWLARMNGRPVAAAIEIQAPDGYSGSIGLLMAADFHGKVLGVRVTQHHETPGLGDKIELRISDWIRQFTGKQLTKDNDRAWAVKKDGGMFDQFTGATITPRAVVSAVKRATTWLESLPERIPERTPAIHSCATIQ